MSQNFDMIAHGIVVHHSDAPTRPDLGPAIEAALRSAYAAGAAAERERCLHIACEYARRYADYAIDRKSPCVELDEAAREACNNVALGIRARSGTTKPEGK